MKQYKTTTFYFLFLGQKYIKDGCKRAKSRYNYQTGMRRTMKQYKTTTGDDVSITFFQTTNNKNRQVYKYATKKELVAGKKFSNATTQTTNSQPEVSEDEDEPGLSQSIESSTPATPSSKRRKGTPTDRNVCRKCKLVYNSKMDDDYDSLWINCAHRGCEWWVHMYCLGINVADKDVDNFESTVKIYCPTHNPHQLPRPNFKRKL